MLPSSASELKPVGAQPARPSPSAPSSVKRSVRCIRCARPLYYLSPLPSSLAILCCERCGARTRIPTFRSRTITLACFVFCAVALVLVVFAALHKGSWPHLHP
jgi:hypothetical protein